MGHFDIGAVTSFEQRGFDTADRKVSIHRVHAATCSLVGQETRDCRDRPRSNHTRWNVPIGSRILSSPLTSGTGHGTATPS